MGNRQVQIGVRGGPEQQLAVDANSAFVLAKADGSRGIEGPVQAVVRLRREQLLELSARLLVPVQFDEHAGVFLARDPIVGCQIEDCGQQQLRVIVHLARDANAGQQAHGFDFIAVLKKIGPDQRLGRVQVVIGK